MLRYKTRAIMTTAVKAIYEDGVFKPKEPVELEERTEVEILIPSRAEQNDGDPTGWKAAEELIGFIKDAPPDMAENHDYYLYGRPRE
jgi:predicted DNA-binding antitoxin AbrB/MazE fold protein